MVVVSSMNWISNENHKINSLCYVCKWLTLSENLLNIQGIILLQIKFPMINRVIASAIVIAHTILFQSNIFCPSSTPKGSKLNKAIQPLNEAPLYRYR